MTLYAGRELFEVELGDSDPKRVVSRFKTMARLVRGLERELGDTVFTLMEKDADAPVVGSGKGVTVGEGSVSA